MTQPRILAMETSCDETAAAVVCGRQVLGSAVASQIDIHIPYGGVVPEIASRHHIEALLPVTEQALAQAGCTINDIDYVAATYGPGLVGALLCGLSYAKGLALAAGKPLMGVHHIEGHISANYIAHPELTPPFACLVVSGGHSHLIRVGEDGGFTTLARTRDDAAGEAFDKAARVLRLPYPGGPHLDELAESGDPTALQLRRPNVPDGFSFSGLKSSLLQAVARLEKEGRTLPPADIAASFRAAVVDELLGVSLPIVLREGLTTLALAGGVACNRLLRRQLTARGNALGIQTLYPPPRLCTDNAEMIGCAAAMRLSRGEPANGLWLNAVPYVQLG